MAKTFILHDESVNTFGFWILTEGIDLSQLKKNPVMCFMHVRPGDEGNTGKDMILPIGRWDNIRKENGQILADATFDLNDDFAKRISDKVEGGFINMASIAVVPLKMSEEVKYLKEGQKRPTVIKCLAKEASIVDMGSNLNALRLYDEEGKTITLSQDPSKCAIPLINQSTTKDNKMKKVIGLLKLADDANEGDVYQAIVKLNETVTGLQTEKTRLEGEIVQLKQTTEADQKARIKTLIDGAVQNRKILESSRADYTALAEKDFDNTKKILDGMPALTKLADGGNEGASKKYEGKKWDDLDKAGQLEELKLADMGKFKELYQEKFGREYK